MICSTALSIASSNLSTGNVSEGLHSLHESNLLALGSPKNLKFVPHLLFPLLLPRCHESIDFALWSSRIHERRSRFYFDAMNVTQLAARTRLGEGIVLPHLRSPLHEPLRLSFVTVCRQRLTGIL